MNSLAKNLTIVAALSVAFGTFGAGTAYAEDTPAAEVKPDNEITYNVAVASDYRFRGLSQTRLIPALQGGADWINNPTGVYAGTWLSTIKWINDAGGDDNIEWDLYAGKRGDITKDVSYDVGGLYYFYPSNGLHPNANTFELYGQLTAGPFSLKYSQSLTNAFGFADSKNSGYLDANFNYDVYQGYTLNVHAGHQNIKNSGSASYSDYKIGVTKDFGIVSVSLAAIKADTSAYVAPDGKSLAKTGAVLIVTKTF